MNDAAVDDVVFIPSEATHEQVVEAFRCADDPRVTERAARLRYHELSYPVFLLIRRFIESKEPKLAVDVIGPTFGLCYQPLRHSGPHQPLLRAR